MALLEAFGGTLPAIYFQKALFLFARKQAVRAFDFVPYRYGCFSFQANQDIAALKTYGYINISADNGTVALVKYENFFAQLSLFDQQHITEIRAQLEGFSQDDLVKYTYTHFPCFTIIGTLYPKKGLQGALF